MDFRQMLERDSDKPGIGKIAGGELISDPKENATSDFFTTGNTGSSPACLDLRLANGKRKALPYSFFTEMNFDMERGIEIFTGSKKITITGRNLTKLFDYLVTYRVRYIRANIGNDQREDGLFVKDIMVEELE